MASFPGQPVQASMRKAKPIYFNEARDDGVAVATAGPYTCLLYTSPSPRD